jgi:hypothetical protein
VFASERIFGKTRSFLPCFPADQVMNRHAPTWRRKRYGENQHDQRRNQHSRQRRGTGRARRAGKGLLEERDQLQEGRAQGPDSRQGANQNEGAAPKKEAKAAKKAAKPALAKKTVAPRAESKGAKIIRMIGRTKGATLAEIMKRPTGKRTGVRGFISTAAKKHRLTIESAKTEAGDRVYQIAK